MYNGTTWGQIAPYNPETMAAAGSLLYADYGYNGIWLYNGTSWSQITPYNPEAMAAAGSLLYARLRITASGCTTVLMESAYTI